MTSRTRKIAIVIVGTLVALIAIVAIVGAMLPRDHVATMTVTVHSPPDRVWAALTDVSAYPTWRPDVQKVDMISSSPLSWREQNAQGSMTLATEAFEPPRRMVARIQDKDQPFGGAWEYQVAADSADPTKSRVTITERGWVSNPIFRFVSAYIMGHYGTLDSYLRALATKFGSDGAPVRL